MIAIGLLAAGDLSLKRAEPVPLGPASRLQARDRLDRAGRRSAGAPPPWVLASINGDARPVGGKAMGNQSAAAGFHETDDALYVLGRIARP